MKEQREKLWNINYIWTMVANFSMYFAFYLLTPLLPLYLNEHFGATKDLIGVILSGYTIAALLFRPFSGYFVDSFNRKKVLLFFSLLYFIFFGFYLVAGTVLLFAVVRSLHGAPFGAFTVANSTVAIDVLPSSRRNEGIGYYGLSNNVATAIAPTVGILIYKQTHDFNLLFLLAFLFALIGLIASARVQIPQKEIQQNVKKISLDRFFLMRGWLLGVNMIFFSFCYGVLSNYLAIYGKQVLGTTDSTGLYFMILSLGLIVSRLQGNKMLKRGKLIFNAGSGLLFSMAGYTIFIALPNEIGYYLSALLIGLGNGHMYPAFQNMIIKTAYHNERGTANSTLLTCWDIGVGLGIMIGGIVAEYFGYTMAFWTMVAVHFAGLVLFFVQTRPFFLKHQVLS
ncbi:MAG: MFS transporter [Bacteroidales bacterium]|nr:MFS transporter [Bacteroidales bacterium]